jgi:hypothetical protein
MIRKWYKSKMNVQLLKFASNKKPSYNDNNHINSKLSVKNNIDRLGSFLSS